MVKLYLRYEPTLTFGVISSGNGNAIYDSEGKLALTPALEDVVIWNIKQGIQVRIPFFRLLCVGLLFCLFFQYSANSFVQFIC